MRRFSGIASAWRIDARAQVSVSRGDAVRGVRPTPRPRQPRARVPAVRAGDETATAPVSFRRAPLPLCRRRDPRARRVGAADPSSPSESMSDLRPPTIVKRFRILVADVRYSGTTRRSRNDGGRRRILGQVGERAWRCRRTPAPASHTPSRSRQPDTRRIGVAVTVGCSAASAAHQSPDATGARGARPALRPIVPGVSDPAPSRARIARIGRESCHGIRR
jgi:hypothetical protein